MRKPISSARPRAVLLVLALAIATPALADSFNVFASATAHFDTNGVFPGSGTCTDPNFPACSVTVAKNGTNAASAISSQQGTTSDIANPPLTTSSAFASVSASEGHIGLSFSADTEGIGIADGEGNANWSDLLTLSSGTLAVGTWVTLQANLNITAEFVGLGNGSASVSACFNGSGLYNICTSGSDSDTAPGPVLPPPGSAQFFAQIGQQIVLSGSASGSAVAFSPIATETDSSWSMLATDSAHFSIQAVDPSTDVDLTLASGCSITTGFGCDPVPGSETPEPASLWLMLGGAIALLAMAKLSPGARRARR